MDVKRFEMTIEDLKQLFIKELSEIYSTQEIVSLYHIICEHKLHLKRIDIALNPNFKLERNLTSYFFQIIEKLKTQIPIQYIMGFTEFYELTFKVNKHVLIPRQETEELVNWIIKDNNRENSNLKILDIGTGSGCIAISLAKNLPYSKIYSLDISKDAIKVAKENAKSNKVDVEFINKDILSFNQIEEKFDIIVSNPPYVRNNEKKEINKNVLNYEPHIALFVNDDNPLLFYDKICEFAKNNLKKNGALYFEINQYLGNQTVELIKSKGFKDIRLRKDINQNDRMIKAKTHV